MKVAIHQPIYFPWLGYFYKIALADVFVFLDDAQFCKNRFDNRNRIAGQRGTQWLTVPVRHPLGQAINETCFADPRWARKHLGTIRAVYGRSPGFAACFPVLSVLFDASRWKNLAEFNMAAAQQVCRLLGLPVPTVCSSALRIDGTGGPRLAEIVRAVGGDTYLSGQGGANYQTPEDFELLGVQLEYLKYPEFRCWEHSARTGQSQPKEDQPPLSVLDFLFTFGKEARERFSSYLSG
jgi:hypothetical protein